jgi:hypothetical protein
VLLDDDVVADGEAKAGAFSPRRTTLNTFRNIRSAWIAVQSLAARRIDCNHGLIGEGRRKLYLLIGEWADS